MGKIAFFAAAEEKGKKKNHPDHGGGKDIVT